MKKEVNNLKVKETFNIDKDEIQEILKEYLSKKGFNNITSLKITVGENSHDLISGCGYIGMHVDVENTKDIN